MQSPHAAPADHLLLPIDVPRAPAAGRTCDTCVKRIASSIDGVGCAACQIAFHHDCLDAPDVCPRCNQSMSAQDRAALEAKREAIARREQRERAVHRSMAAVCVVFTLLVIVGAAYVLAG